MPPVWGWWWADGGGENVSNKGTNSTAPLISSEHPMVNSDIKSRKMV